MATINRIALSERRLAVQPSVMSYTPRATAQHARDIAALGQQASQTIDFALNTIDRIKERDAQIMKEQWVAGSLRLLNGTVVRNADGTETRIPGAGQKTWQDYQAQGTNKSPITDLADYEHQFQNSPEFQAMDSITRTKFNRMMQVPRAEAEAKANELYDRMKIARDKHFDDVGNANDDEILQRAIYGRDEEFDKVLGQVAKSKTDRRFRRFDKTDPQVAEAYRTALMEEGRKGAMERVDALCLKAANGEVTVIGGEIKSPLGDIERADGYIASLEKRNLLMPQDVQKLSYRTLQARSRLSSRMKDEIGAAADETRFRLFEKGGLAEAENVIAGLRAMAGTKRPGTDIPMVGKDVSNAALAAAQKIDTEADRFVTADLWDRLVKGERLTVPLPTSDGSTVETPIFEAETRQARILPALQAEFNRQTNAIEDKATKELQGRNEASLRANMLMAAKTSPGTFSATLAEYSKANGISLRQYSDIRKEFHNVWLKEGIPEKAAAMVQTFKNTFFADADFDLNSLYQFNKSTNAIELKPPKDFDTNNLKVAYEAKSGTQTLEPSEQLYLLNWATRLAEMDGETVSVDPESGERLDKPIKINAAEFFQRLCTRMKFGKEVASKEEAIARRMDAMLPLRAGIAERDAAAEAENAKRQRPSAPATVKMPARPGTPVRTEQE